MIFNFSLRGQSAYADFGILLFNIAGVVLFDSILSFVSTKVAAVTIHHGSFSSKQFWRRGNVMDVVASSSLSADKLICLFITVIYHFTAFTAHFFVRCCLIELFSKHYTIRTWLSFIHQ